MHPFQAWSWLAAFVILAFLGNHSFLITGTMMVVLGLTGALGNIELNTYLTQAVDEGMLARVTSIVRMMTFATCALGSALGGLLAQDTADNAPWILLALTAILPALSFLAPTPKTRATTPCHLSDLH